MRQLGYLLLLVGAISLVTYSCTEEDAADLTDVALDIVEPDVSLDDADAINDIIGAVSDAAEEIPGDLPDPTANPSLAADIQIVETGDEDEDIVATNGREAKVGLEVTDVSEVGGLYLQAEGAKSYYDIPLEDLLAAGSSSSRVLSGDSALAIPLNISEKFKPGKFCFTYCVYDRQNRVSNAIRRCVEVKQLGGDKAGLLLGTWELVRIVDEYDDNGTIKTEENIVGVTEIDTNYFWCDTIQEERFVLEESRTDKLEFTLSDDGSFSFVQQEYRKELDHSVWPIEDCENPPIREEDRDDSEEGGWSYDNETKTFVLIGDFDNSDADTTGNGDGGDEGLNGIEFKIIENTESILTLEVSFCGQGESSSGGGSSGGGPTGPSDPTDHTTHGGTPSDTSSASPMQRILMDAVAQEEECDDKAVVYFRKKS